MTKCTFCSKDLHSVKKIYSVFGYLFCSIKCSTRFMKASTEIVTNREIGLD